MARGGHTEAGVTLANLVGATPAVLLSEIVSEDGSMARGETLANFARSHQLLIISIAEIKEYLVESPPPPKVSVPPKFPFDWAEIQLPNGSWMIATYPSLKQREQVVLKYGEDKYGEEKGVPLLRIHSECFTGDVLHSQRCDCGEQLSKSIELIERQGFGYIIYLRDHEGRGIGLTEKLKAYILQNEGLDTVDANLRLGHGIDEREWEDAISILRELNIPSVKLLTNNPDKVDIVKRAGIECQQISLSVAPNEFNARYLSTKAERLGHLGGH
jgi:3,4-dihydroxy 2-butanone 4-phosphate synthase/GTP cyclohydrolase II